MCWDKGGERERGRERLREELGSRCVGDVGRGEEGEEWSGEERSEGESFQITKLITHKLLSLTHHYDYTLTLSITSCISK